jgi:hypothetical protein
MNRNINLIIDDSGSIEGYQNIKIQDLNNVINGFVNNIICECLDKIEFAQRLDVFKAILSKLAFDGTATFKCINATMLSSRILKNEIDAKKISDIIKDINSLWTESLIVEAFSSFPNIVVQKNYIEHIYTVITVTKTL